MGLTVWLLVLFFLKTTVPIMSEFTIEKSGGAWYNWFVKLHVFGRSCDE